MFRCITDIKITQNSEGRNKTLLFNFVTNFEASDTWVDLTNQAKITIPKNIYAKDQNGKLYPLGGDNKNIGGFSNDQPLFLKGDKVTINFGYYRYDKLGNEYKEMPAEPIFTGFITEVTSAKPIELKCEDNMYLLKQLPAPNKTFPSSMTWENILRELIKTTNFTVNALTTTKIGDFRIMNETVAQVIERVRKDYHLEAYFRGNELRCGSKVYVDADNFDANGNEIVKTFVFQNNIISDDLMYKRNDDIVLSAICYSVNKNEVQETTKTGKVKTKQSRLEILVYWDSQKKEFKYQTKEKGKEYPANVEGERRTLYFWDIKSVDQLFKNGVDELKKYYYTGFKGKFTTFGMPYVRSGDNIIIKDAILPERNGKYKVKAVNYSGGNEGHRQEIVLDYLIANI